MKEALDEFYICEEDDIFDERMPLYEDLKENIYKDAQGLDPSLEWDQDDLDSLELSENADLDEDYGTYDLDFDCGDILLAKVYQDNASERNLSHKYRPFLIIYSNANMAYGFQLSTSLPTSLLNYRVPIKDYARCGLEKPSAIIANMIRGVYLNKLVKYIGHITEEVKNDLLDKLYEIKENKDGLYDDCPLNDRLDPTINNIKRIRCNTFIGV